MKTLWLLLCLLVCGVAVGRPSQGYRLLPRRAVMFGGYYSNPLFARNFDYVPRGAMSAVVTRDTVATNTFAGETPQYPPLDALPLEENETLPEKAAELLPPQYGPPEPAPAPLEPETHDDPAPTQLEIELPEKAPQLPQELPQLPQEQPQQVPHEVLSPAVPSEAALIDDVAEEVSTEAVTKASKRLPKKKVVRPTPPPAEEEEEDDEQGLSATWPFGGSRGVPSYNAFFPISISGAAPTRTRSQGQSQQGGLEDYFPGSATAIANSFSTGKGGIATSHATSFGDPYLASLVRNGLLNFRTKKPQEP